ncbi:MAG TPA: CAP domain-containing protein, partial [Thermomonospora sp.]|nr:CAP domain-containing protein [Thermomonospora sp.]
RTLVTALTLTGAVLAVGAGVGLDRVVVPAFEGSGDDRVLAQRDRSAGDSGTDAAAGARTAPGDPATPGTPGRPAPRDAQQPPEEAAPPLKRLRMPDPSPSTPDRPGDDGSGPGGGGSAPPSGAAGLEAAVVRLTNAERAKAGCSALRVDQRLVASARRHSADMAAKGYFDHTSPNGDTFADRIKAAGYPSPGAENIARGHPTAAAVVQGWMNSPGHRANILNCGLKALGVGVRTGSGGPWWTQNFGWV